MTQNQIKSLINNEFQKLDEFQQNKLLRRISLTKANYKQFINGDRVGKLGKEKSINANTLFALCSELGISLSATKTKKQCHEISQY